MPTEEFYEYSPNLYDETASGTVTHTNIRAPALTQGRTVPATQKPQEPVVVPSDPWHKKPAIIVPLILGLSLIGYFTWNSLKKEDPDDELIL